MAKGKYEGWTPDNESSEVIGLFKDLGLGNKSNDDSISMEKSLGEVLSNYGLKPKDFVEIDNALIPVLKLVHKKVSKLCESGLLSKPEEELDPSTVAFCMGLLLLQRMMSMSVAARVFAEASHVDLEDFSAEKVFEVTSNYCKERYLLTKILSMLSTESGLQQDMILSSIDSLEKEYGEKTSSSKKKRSAWLKSLRTLWKKTYRPK